MEPRVTASRAVFNEIPTSNKHQDMKNKSTKQRLTEKSREIVLSTPAKKKKVERTPSENTKQRLTEKTREIVLY